VSRRGSATTTQRHPALRAVVRLVCGVLLTATTGCQLLRTPTVSLPAAESPSPTIASMRATWTPSPAAPTATPTIDLSQPFTITLWVPPDLAATAEQGTEGLLAQARQHLAASSPRARIEILPKAVTGPGGIPKLLAAMQPVLSSRLPDAVLLDAADIPPLVESGLVIALDDLLADNLWDDLYPFAKQAVTVEGALYGMPQDADLTAMFYNSGMLSKPPVDWESLLGTKGGYLLPLRPGDGTAFRLLLSHYSTLDGPLRDSDGALTLDATVAARVLRGYWNLMQSGAIPEGGFSLDSADACWAVYLTGEAAICSATSYQYLRDRERLRFTRYTAQASWGGPAPALAAARAWAIVTTDPARQELVAQFISHCALPARAAAWLRTSYHLPTSRSPLPLLMEDEEERAFWNSQLEAAFPAPDATIRERLRPILEQALQDVLDGSVTPEQAAMTAVLAVESTP